MKLAFHKINMIFIPGYNINLMFHTLSLYVLADFNLIAHRLKNGTYKSFKRKSCRSQGKYCLFQTVSRSHDLVLFLKHAICKIKNIPCRGFICYDRWKTVQYLPDQSFIGSGLSQ